MGRIIVPRSGYIRIPNQSPSLIPTGRANGHMQQLSRWLVVGEEQHIEGLRMRRTSSKDGRRSILHRGCDGDDSSTFLMYGTSTNSQPCGLGQRARTMDRCSATAAFSPRRRRPGYAIFAAVFSPSRGQACRTLRTPARWSSLKCCDKRSVRSPATSTSFP